ncbi:hypothetical protein [Pseudoduganella umbonata]|uniref:Phage-related tail protein n=1 Tax=Pseudoduganella umbonata TaxID=864828 RepID=A0A4P8HMM3_9BURK|nr:hypothetical protein [Pseudoduganella umbonata]MBB3219620.1 phage-related tail protein [Pseudoduganella umbonata]QCP09684.1 hypothetical protein FCL38_04045 [Pseudoduganella umbonata]
MAEAAGIDEALALARALADRMDTLEQAGGDPGRPGVTADQLAALAGRIEMLRERLQGECAAVADETAAAAEALAAAAVGAEAAIGDAAGEARQAAAAFSERLVELDESAAAVLAAGREDVAGVAGRAAAQLADALEQAGSAWQETAGKAQRHVDGLLDSSMSHLRGDADEAAQAMRERLQRYAALQASMADVVRRVDDTIGLFADSMQATQTGLNLTAGTLNDIVGILSDVA